MAIVAVAAIAVGFPRPVTAQEASPEASPPAGVDPFYLPPDDLPVEPGVLLRSEPFTRAVPAGALAWRILYTTTRDDATPAVASAIVVAAAEAPDGPRPVIAWTHGTTGFAEKCAPSLLDEPFLSGALPALDQIVAEGWVLVATDYVGLGTAGPHPYLIGQAEARSSLDAVRAARQLTELTLDNKVVAWGHSQGGHAALWTGQIAPTYAPDVTLVGVAALAPATDLNALLVGAQGSPFGSMVSSFVVTAYSQNYPDVSFAELVEPAAQPGVQLIAGLCLSGDDAAMLIGTAMQLPSPLLVGDPTSGAFGARLAENTPGEPIAAPLLVAQGLADEAVLPSVQEGWIQARCDAGQSLTYRTYEGRDHVGVVAPDSALIADLLAWTTDRLAGAAPEAGCQTIAG